MIALPGTIANSVPYPEKFQLNKTTGTYLGYAYGSLHGQAATYFVGLQDKDSVVHVSWLTHEERKYCSYNHSFNLPR
jgi:hypothetical protein